MVKLGEYDRKRLHILTKLINTEWRLYYIDILQFTAILFSVTAAIPWLVSAHSSGCWSADTNKTHQWTIQDVMSAILRLQAPGMFARYVDPVPFKKFQ